MKINKNMIILFVAITSLLTGCDKYLDITPKGKRLLTTVADYDQWMNSDLLINTVGQAFNTLNLLSDNVDNVNITNPPTAQYDLIYSWSQQFSADMQATPVFWGDHYAIINHFNTVILGIDQATGGTNVQKKSLKAEALLGRAYEYFYLVNLYGRPYDSETADKDLAVPFVVSNDVSQLVPDRSTVADVNQRIIEDLNFAVNDLPADNSTNRFRGSKAAAYSLLARIYFYQRNYVEAQKNAALALDFTNATMLDLNEPITSVQVSIRRDVIYGRMFMGSNTVALEYMQSFAENDLRVRTFYNSADDYTFIERGATQYSPLQVTPQFIYENSGTSVQEMKLIIAECAARGGDLTLALKHLEELQKNRLDRETYEPYYSNDKESVLQEVLLERNRELGFSGLRWFDMRRLDKENRMPTIYRRDAQENIIFTLPPKGDRYTLQIPIQALSFNPGMQQNP
ncbi:RagB/SusD family nutrient uptake outer membrane protein [Sphingobacterium tabacisoli]|uniref:RagB/SusD family nutrient uptake outer membrane protein n=1 Tax=Sphingobacterium tabacisoli TaxID=2044855 RepID=A0ABW5L9Z3_9SPHI|nr:RagB/SusD family nutrient uptake outer membrane protein [Sphingobacterium tabacisoli]